MVFKKGNTPWNIGMKTPEETKQKIIKAIKEGRWGMTNKRHSEETKKILSKKAIGRKHTIETRNKMSATRKGEHHSKEHNMKVSLALKGKKKSKEHMENIIKSKEYLKGKTYEEIFGIEEANRIKAKLRIINGGKNNGRWRGGISFEPYDKTFNLKFKKAIRKRENQVCILCGIHREKLKRALDIHHINYDKLLSVQENCISLCKSCHMKTNNNRTHWTSFFQSLLSEKYGYKYAINGDIIKDYNENINEVYVL